MLRDPGLDAAAVRDQRTDALAVALLGLGPNRVRFRKEAAGVECDDFDAQSLAEYGVGDCLVLQTEAGGEDNRTGYLGTDVSNPLEQVAPGRPRAEPPGNMVGPRPRGKADGGLTWHGKRLVSLDATAGTAPNLNRRIFSEKTIIRRKKENHF
jgi:hypothetical protein